MAAEAQIAADIIALSSLNLPGWVGPAEGMEELPCLLPTPKLVDLRWATARARSLVANEPLIEPAPQDNGGIIKTQDSSGNIISRIELPELLKFTTRALSESVDSQIRSPAQWVADPGKVLALHSRLRNKDDSIAINYGWHWTPASKGAPHLQGVTTGHFMAQSVGGLHTPPRK